MPLRQIDEEQQKFESNKKDYKRYGWKNIAIKIKENDLILFNRQLNKLGFETRRSGKGTSCRKDNTIDRR